MLLVRMRRIEIIKYLNICNTFRKEVKGFQKKVKQLVCGNCEQKTTASTGRRAAGHDFTVEKRQKSIQMERDFQSLFLNVQFNLFIPTTILLSEWKGITAKLILVNLVQ